MALTFVAASSQFLSKASGLVAYPCAFSCWFNLTSAATNQILIRADDGTSNNRFVLDVNAGNVRAFNQNVGTSGVATTSTTYTANTWNHACGVFLSTTSRAVYLNGGGKGTNATSVVPAAMTEVGIAASPLGATFVDGALAFPAIWNNVSFVDQDVTTLSLSIHPLRVHPEKLVACLPLVGASPEIDYMSSTGWTLHGTPTVSSNPRIYGPTGMIVGWPLAATVNATLTMTPTVTMFLSGSTGQRAAVIYSDGWGGHKYIK